MTVTPPFCWRRRIYRLAGLSVQRHGASDFQPAEEAIGGADLMIKDGLFEQFPANASLACTTCRPACRQAGLYAGNFMASADTVKITITGYGGHGAHPSAPSTRSSPVRRW